MTPTPAIAHLPRAILSVAVVLTLATGCSNPEANAPTPPSSEPTPSDAQQTLPAASAPAIDLRAAADYSRRHQGDGLLVLRNGITVHSDFRAGMGPDTPHLLASGTKSFSGVAAAFAVSDGLLRLDEKVSDTITEWQGDPAKRDITVRQLLSLSAGIAPLSSTIDNPRNARAAGIIDRARASIDARSVAPAGSRFIYGPSSFYVFGELMKRKLVAAGTGDADVVAYLERRLFRPLDIAPRFLRDGAGNANLPGGCRLSATDWATFGEWMRLGGRRTAAEAPLVDPRLLDELLRPTDSNARYGLTWWLLRQGDDDPEAAIAADMAADRLSQSERDDTDAGPMRQAIRERFRERVRAQVEASAPSRTMPTHTGALLGSMAAGKGKQRLYILPEHGLTIVRFGELEGGREFRDAEFLELVLRGLGIAIEGDRITGEAEPR